MSENFIDEVTELAESLNGDGKRLVEALHSGRVNLFRSGKANELETYLEEHGYLESRDTLDDGQIRARVIERCVDDGVPREDAIDRADGLLSRLGEP